MSILAEQIAAVRWYVEHHVFAGDLQRNIWKDALATLEGMAAPGPIAELLSKQEPLGAEFAAVPGPDLYVRSDTVAPSPQQPTQPSIEQFVAERAEKDHAVMAEEARRFDENLESGLDDFEKAVALMGPDNSPQQPTKAALVDAVDYLDDWFGFQNWPPVHRFPELLAGFAAQRVTAAPVSGDARERARKIAATIVNEQGADIGPHWVIMPDTWRRRIAAYMAAEMTAATDKARREAIEECAHFVESGIFLTDSSPAYHFANECAAAIRRALTPQNPGDATGDENA